MKKVTEPDIIERCILATGGVGLHQLRTMFLLTLPLIGLTGLWQFPIFYGMNLPHECHESNQTFHRHSVDNYTDCMMESTYTSEFELYCDRKHIAPLLASAANIGGLAGHLIWGVCQDWFGRRKTNIFCSLMTFLFSLSLCFVPQYNFNGKLPEYSLFLLIRFFFGLCANGMGSYTLPVELVSSKKRWMVGLFMGTGWGLGTFWHLASVYLFRNWRDAMLMQVIPLSVCLLYPWLLPESPRWLLRKNKKSEAIKLLREMAETNGRRAQEEVTASLRALQETQKYEIDNLLPKAEELNESALTHISKNITIFIRFILITSIHLVGSTLWYTIMFSVGKFPGCPFFIYFIFGIIDGPLRIALQGVVLKIARRKGIAMGIGGAAIFFLLSQIMTYTNSARQAILIFGFAAKFLSAFYWPFIETYNSEINPTVIRDSVAGLTSSIAGLGGVMTPSLMVFDYHPPTISIISILITNLLCLLPTTLNHNLPETFEEAAAIQDKVNMFIEQRRKRSSKDTVITHIDS